MYDDDEHQMKIMTLKYRPRRDQSKEYIFNFMSKPPKAGRLLVYFMSRLYQKLVGCLFITPWSLVLMFDSILES